MKKLGYIALALTFSLGLIAVAQAGQTILRAFSPATTDGSQVVLQIDWDQVKKAAPEATQVSIRRRPAGMPVKSDSVTYLQAGTPRYTDTGLDADTQYHYFASFKDAEGNTLKFGSARAVVHLGPIATLPGKH